MIEYAVIAGVVGIAMALIEIIKGVINYFLNQEKNKDINYIQKTVQGISSKQQTMFEMHDKYDLDGTPIWYVPRSWAETQKEILQCTHQVSQTQKEIGKTMERMATLLDRIDRREHKE